MRENTYKWLKLVWMLLMSIIIFFFFLQILKKLEDIKEIMENYTVVIYEGFP